MEGTTIRKFMLEVTTYPNGEQFLKTYPVGKREVKTVKKKSVVKDKFVGEVETVLL